MRQVLPGSLSKALPFCLRQSASGLIPNLAERQDGDSREYKYAELYLPKYLVSCTVQLLRAQYHKPSLQKLRNPVSKLGTYLVHPQQGRRLTLLAETGSLRRNVWFSICCKQDESTRPLVLAVIVGRGGFIVAYVTRYLERHDNLWKLASWGVENHSGRECSLSVHAQSALAERCALVKDGRSMDVGPVLCLL